MEQLKNQVEEYYNQHISDEDRRLDYNIFELPLTLKYIRKYVRKGARILDIACGTGRYAGILLDMGYKMALNDIASKNVELVERRFAGNKNVIMIEQSDALRSNIWERSNWDAILMLGPLYHIINENNRLYLLKRSKEALAKNGYLFSAFMSRVQAMIYGIKHNAYGILDNSGSRQLWETGTDKTFVEGTEWFKHTYFAFPEEIDPLIERAGLKPLHLIGIEGLFGERMDLFHQLDPRLKTSWMNFIFRHCEETHMINQSKHLLSISTK